jgi:hypothetical protein
MRLAPDGMRPEAVRSEAWNKVPVHMGHHISEKFIINLIRLKEFVKGSRNSGDFFHQLFPGVPVQVEKLRNVPFADDKGIAGKKLIPVENRITEVEFDDPQFRLVIPFRAHRAGFHKLKTSSIVEIYRMQGRAYAAHADMKEDERAGSYMFKHLLNNPTLSNFVP